MSDLGKDIRSANDDFSGFMRWKIVTLFIDNAQVNMKYFLTHGTGLDDRIFQIQ